MILVGSEAGVPADERGDGAVGDVVHDAPRRSGMAVRVTKPAVNWTRRCPARLARVTPYMTETAGKVVAGAQGQLRRAASMASGCAIPSVSRPPGTAPVACTPIRLPRIGVAPVTSEAVSIFSRVTPSEP